MKIKGKLKEGKKKKRIIIINTSVILCWIEGKPKDSKILKDHWAAFKVAAPIVLISGVNKYNNQNN